MINQPVLSLGNKKSFQSLLTLVLALSLSACGLSMDRQQVTVTHEQLNQTQWKLTRLNGAPTIPGTEVHVTFSDDRAAGSTGANQFSATYSLAENNSITFGRAISTKRFMPFPKGAMQQESDFLAALMQIDRIHIDSQYLVLSAQGVELMFEVF